MRRINKLVINDGSSDEPTTAIHRWELIPHRPVHAIPDLNELAVGIDFSVVLSLLLLFSGAIWLSDTLFFARARNARNAAYAEGVLKEKPSWLAEQMKSIFPVVLLVLSVRSFAFEPFQIPSGSMMPTLLVGDFIVVNKFAYGMRLPVSNQKVLDLGGPKRGDVVVFRRPQRMGMAQDPSAGMILIKRCVGLPGDRISYRNHEFRINGVLVEHLAIAPYADEASSKVMLPSVLQTEYLDGVTHQTLLSQYSQLNGEWIVPEDHYFMMGDNRDGSSDSREWGYVPEANLMGRAGYIWFHFDWAREGWVAWNRLGKKMI